MRYYVVLILVVLLGAAVLCPILIQLGLDPVPGDIPFHLGGGHDSIPVTYSLCASMGLGLFYYLMKR